MRLAPDLQILEIAHAQGKRRQPEVVTSFRLERNPMRRELQQAERLVRSERSD
jgi:hypothetical protein